MMISCLMLFISMFGSAEDSLRHYNNTRVINKKGVTIASQKRYVKFLEGFLTTELLINPVKKEEEPTPSEGNRITSTSTSWFELYLKRYNKLIENMAFNDMAKK